MCCIGHQSSSPVWTPFTPPHEGPYEGIARQTLDVRRSVLAAFTAAGLEPSEEQIRLCSYVKSRFCPVAGRTFEENGADSVWCGRAAHEFIKGLQETGHLLISSATTCECCFCAITRVGGGRHPAFLGYPLPEGGPSCSQSPLSAPAPASVAAATPVAAAASVPAPASVPTSVTLVTAAGTTFNAPLGCGPVASPARPHGPITGVSISYAVVHFANKAGISQAEAEAVLAQLKPADGHRANALLAQQAFARFAKSNGIPVTGAITTMREWANGRE